MTIQIDGGSPNKQDLQTKLNTQPAQVILHDPGIHGRTFRGNEISNGDKFPVVMDHPKRLRFAQIERRYDGTFKVL